MTDKQVVKGFRAPAGGCFGISGSWYEGGQFLPQHEIPRQVSVQEASLWAKAWGEAEEVGRAISKAQQRQVAQLPANAFVLSWLRGHAQKAYHVFSAGHGTWLITHPSKLTPEQREIEMSDDHDEVRVSYVFTSDFLSDLHGQIQRGGVSSLSDRQFGALARNYAKEHGRPGSKAYQAAEDEFYAKAGEEAEPEEHAFVPESRTPAALLEAARAFYSPDIRPRLCELLSAPDLTVEAWTKKQWAERFIFDAAYEQTKDAVFARRIAAEYGERLKKHDSTYRCLYCA